MSPQTFIFVGRSGSGKGTQAELFMKYLNSKSNDPIFYLESGQKFREFISSSSYTAKLSNEVMQKGELQPAFLAIHVWSHLMIEQMDQNKTLIIDGTPRKIEEAKILDEAFKFYGRKNIQIIHVNVSRNWSVDRLTGRGRADDKSIEEINKRLDWFDTDVMPAVEYYKNNPDYKFIDINGEQTIEEVQVEIQAKLGLASEKHE